MFGGLCEADKTEQEKDGKRARSSSDFSAFDLAQNMFSDHCQSAPEHILKRFLDPEKILSRTSTTSPRTSSADLSADFMRPGLPTPWSGHTNAKVHTYNTYKTIAPHSGMSIAPHSGISFETIDILCSDSSHIDLERHKCYWMCF